LQQVDSREERQRKVELGVQIIATIAQHIRFESKLQGKTLSVKTFCLDQKESLVSDLDYVMGGK